MKLIRLSPYCQPQVRVGRCRMWPANMADGADRIAYLRGLLEYVTTLSEAVSTETLLSCIHRIPFALELLELSESDGHVTARARSEITDSISFDVNRLAVAIIDGRNRSERGTAFMRTGTDTGSYGQLLRSLQRGVSEADLDALARREGLDSGGLISTMAGRNLVEEVDLDTCSVAERFVHLKGDRLTWLGHAAAMLQSDGVTIWIDPYLTPRIAWTPEEQNALFSNTFADSRLFESYGPCTPHFSIGELPAPDAVLITHQDCDHLDLGVLMTVPEQTPIVVPEPCGQGWDVDVPHLIRRTLGESRQVIALGHGKTLSVNDVQVTAFPFHGEMPNCLMHRWNCYLLKTRRSAVAFTADSRLDEENIGFLAGAMQGSNVGLTLCAGAPTPVATMPGWREGLTSTNLWASGRLWGWYTPVANMFDPTPCADVTYEQLNQLATQAGLRYFFPYARGSAPWFRIQDSADTFYLPVGSMTAAELDAIDAELRSLSGRVQLFPGKYGVPTRVDEYDL